MPQVLAKRSVPNAGVLREPGLGSVFTGGHVRAFSVSLCAGACPARLLPRSTYCTSHGPGIGGAWPVRLGVPASFSRWS